MKSGKSHYENSKYQNKNIRNENRYSKMIYTKPQNPESTLEYWNVR